ncbi:MAG: phospholipase D-like domain-containing protein [Candidatus Pacebacteria bacterium]|nr:phospholipase D-like domain-containing protein [Candidatus Paceibacterota bacterium]
MGSRAKRRFFVYAVLVLLSIAGSAFYGSAAQTATPQSERFTPSVSGTQTLVIEPQDGTQSIVRMVQSASSSVDIVMYEFEDIQLEQLLAQRAKAGIAVRVILDNGYFGAGSSANQSAFDYFQTNGVQVHWSSASFALTHEKSLVIDGTQAFVMTFNLTPKYYKGDRDFGVIDTDQNDVTAMEQTFNADWSGQRIPSQNGDHLVWSPNSRDQLLSLIQNATSSLEVYNEEMQDPQIITALEGAAKRGVNVEIDMTYSKQWRQAFDDLSQSGAHIRTYKASAPLYIHAKVIIADAAEAFVGSENFSSSSLDQNRELGLMIADPEIVSRLTEVFQGDWQGATPFAL